MNFCQMSNKIHIEWLTTLNTLQPCRTTVSDTFLYLLMELSGWLMTLRD